MGTQKYSGFDAKAHEDNPGAHHPPGTLDPPGAPGTHYLVFTIPEPAAHQANDSEFLIMETTPAAFTISSIRITLNATGNQINGDFKYADAFIGLANPVIINDVDTTNGVRVVTSISIPAVPAGKCLYFSFNSAPDLVITQMGWRITFTYD